MINICIVGAAGRMGKNIAQIIAADEECKISGALDSANGRAIGADIYELAGLGQGGVLVTSDFMEAVKGADVIIDFTGAEATLANVENYRTAKVPVVIGSTGLKADEKAKVLGLSQDIPMILAPNTSLGVNIAFKLVELAAKSLKGYDIEISEIHHRMKKDSPSGTALGFAEHAAKGAGIDLEKNAVYARHGIIGERTDDEIGIQTLRGGDVVGDHTVYFFGNGERIEITHMAHTRATFASGAVTAAKWLAKKPVGFYTMDDVLGIA